MISIPEMTLGSTGKAIPLVGMVTTVYPFAPSETMIDSILTAIELGYRHFDCVAAYLSEKPLGEAIKKAVKLGLIKSRDELFITSKLWCSDAHPDRVLPALQNTLKIFNWTILISISFIGRHGRFQKLSLTKAIGVSNFSCNKLEELLQTASILPAVNQQKKLRELYMCGKGYPYHGILPLGCQRNTGELIELWNVRCSKKLPEKQEIQLPR
ncbi:Non-functional NADPH-dependent codeinone reductase 2 [Vitis vinifera]|uniref:Non-functional NADPH-dependent codeinone reductase 2 n=1 Tax=Vitis vinifera TaxID=29760 RepID=A0A438GQ52_VITVI|nr:Non-functional NADPH-dependent codeinone reductase 2 [Vitis vinifera]